MNMIVVAMITLLLFSTGCNVQNKQKNLELLCCTECTNAFSQSPAGVGPEGAICGRFTTASGMSEECAAYFAEHQTAVVQCQRLLSGDL